MMNLEARFGGGSFHADPSRHATIGSAPDCDILLSAPGVLAHHATLAFDGTSWRAVDTGGGGLLIDGQPVSDHPLAGATWLWVGRDGGGEYVELLPGGATSLSAGAAVQPVGVVDPSLVATASGAPDAAIRPAGGVDPAVVQTAGSHEATTSIHRLGDQSLRLRADAGEFVFGPGKIITVGRGTDNDIVIDNGLVSRRHLQFRHDGTSWQMSDLGSTRGTYLYGRKLKKETVAEGAFNLSLGDDDAGAELRVITAGEHKKPKPRLPLALGTGALVLAALAVGLVFFLNRGGGEEVATGQANSSEQITMLKMATVGIGDEDNIDFVFGTGTIISDDGMILTNAHVADPLAPGIGLSSDIPVEFTPFEPIGQIVVHVSPEEDAPVVPRYRAEVLASDGFLDLAVIQITETIDGDRFRGFDDEDGIVPIPIGDSALIRAGDEIDVFGFPGLAGTDRVTVTGGQIASFVGTDRLGDRSWMNTDAQITGGNSGGLAAINGELIGVPTEAESDLRFAETIGRIRPIEHALDMIEVAENGGRYDSPFVTLLEGTEDGSLRLAAGPQSTCSGSSVSAVDVDDNNAAFHFEIEATGVVEGTHFLILGFAPRSERLVRLSVDWPGELGTEGCLTVEVPLPGTSSGEGWIAELWTGPNFERMLDEVEFETN